MLSPVSKRVVSPSKRLVLSPRGNNHGNYTGADMLCVGFLRYFKWLLAGVVAIAFFRIITMDPYLPSPNVGNPGNFSFDSIASERDSIGAGIASSIDTAGDTEGGDRTGYSETKKLTKKEQKDTKEADFNISGMDTVAATTMSGITKNVSYHHRPTTIDKATSSDATDFEQNGIKESNPMERFGDLMSLYKASNSPVIVNGWNKTVQVHLIVDVTKSEDVNPASKLLFAAVERSKYTQLSAVTFVRPSVETFQMFPRKQDLPLLFLVDWGSMDRDCHRLQMVLENLRSEKQLLQSNKTSPIITGQEEPYFLLVDSSGSTRQTGCSYLFRSVTRDENDSEKPFLYAYTNDPKRIRLAKRSIVQNRYYDRETKKIHMGELSPNRWGDTPPKYDKPVLQSPFPLRESFVIGIHNITEGKPVTNEDSKRGIDVGYFWKSGDYSHYGFYRRDIAKVVKTLHHSTIEKKTSKRMENSVGIVYTEEKGMEAGHVQFRYIEQLLACKIVVITQRDEWEDHYRLMESLASGALVMTDQMVALPEGLIDKVNIVIYDSPKMLKDLIKHYLKPENKNERKRVASKGYKLVMGRHRCWHWLENLLFGRPLTHVDQPYAPAPPKEIPPSYL